MALLAEANWTQPGAGSTHTPTPEELAIIEGYGRKTDDFALASYVKYTPVKNHVGLTYQFKSGMASLMVDVAGTQFEWADSADRPKGDNLAAFRMKEYRCVRRAFPLRMGDIAREEQDIPHDEINKTFAMARAMTLRTAKAVDVLTDETLWDASHVKYPFEIDASFPAWESSLAEDRAIQKCINYGVNRIHLDTEGVIGRKRRRDMILVMNPNTANAIGTSLEIRDFVKQQAGAPQIQKGDGDYGLEDASLPPLLYGVKPVIEDAVKNIANKDATMDPQFIFPDGYAILMFRPGSVEGLAGSQAFSTMHMLFVGGNEMKVEVNHDAWNKFTEWSIVDYYTPELVAPITGFVFKGLTDSTSSA
jgi:hypothetical protein